MCSFIEASAETNTNVEQIFYEVVRQINKQVAQQREGVDDAPTKSGLLTKLFKTKKTQSK